MDEQPTTAAHFRDLAARSHQARRVNALEHRIRAVLAAGPITDDQRVRLTAALNGGQA